MRKCICRLRLNEVSRQWGRRPEPPPSASCSCISCSPTGCPPRGEVGRRPASGRSSRQGMSPPHGCGGRSHGSAARSRCWYGCASNARWENRSRSAFPLYNCTIFSDIVCCLLSEWCVVTSFYQSLQAMSSFMRFSICAPYCTLSSLMLQEL